MHISSAAVFEAAALAVLLSVDTLAASFAYGSDNIKIPLRSVMIINAVCGSILGLSLLLGSALREAMPDWLGTAICFGILFVIGLVKLLDGVTKSIIQKHNTLNKELEFSLFNFKFILNLYANPVDADADRSKIISPAEAASLAVALSFDGLAVGFGAALGDINGWAVLIFSVAANIIAVLLGFYLGNKIAGKLPVNLSWLSGVVLIILAFLKLI